MFDVLYNLACPASPQYYLEHPIETWESSVLGIRNLLEGIKDTNTKLFHSSTSEVYGNALQIPHILRWKYGVIRASWHAGTAPEAGRAAFPKVHRPHLPAAGDR